MEGSALLHKAERAMTIPMNLTQLITVGSVIVSIVVYTHRTFQSKEDAVATTAKIERRLDKVEDAYSDQVKIQGEIKSSVEYIRGRLEPRPK